MNEQIKLQEQALKALISVNKSGVKNLLRRHKYRISDFYSNNDLYAFLIVAMSKDSVFTEDVLTLLKQASNRPYLYADDTTGGIDVASIINGALQGLGMVTTTWQNVATIKADTSKYNTTYTVDGKKSNTLVIAVAICFGVLLLGVAGVMVVKAAK
jgi:hypothetical protein